MCASPLEATIGKLTTVMAGSFVGAIGFMLLGPSPIFGIEPNLWLSLSAYGIIQLGLSMPLVIAVPLSLAKAHEASPLDPPATPDPPLRQGATAGVNPPEPPLTPPPPPLSPPLTPPLTPLPSPVLSKAQEAGFSETDATTQSAMLNVFTAAACLFVGPPIGGYLADTFGVGMAGTILAIFLATLVPASCFVIRSHTKASVDVNLL